MTLDEVIAESTRDGRVCPQPMVWDEIWNLLPKRRQQADGGWEPPLPLILSGWWYSSDHDKRERFLLHLRWADDHGVIDDVARIVAAMKPEDWHMEESAMTLNPR